MKPLILILSLAALGSELLTGADHPRTLDEVVSTVPDGASLQQAFEQARYAARPVENTRGHWSFQNPSHGLSAHFTPAGLSLQVRVAGGPSSTSDSQSSFRHTVWRTTGLGYGDELSTVPEGEVVVEPATPGRVEIRRPGLVEWYVNRSAGLEHGYTVPSPPAINPDRHPLRVEMSLGGDLDAEITADAFHVVLRDGAGTEVLRYEKLKVWDAEGRELAARMVGGGRNLAVEVEDSGATYPITIDPVPVQRKCPKLGIELSYSGQC